MKTTYLPLLIIAVILAAATWTARITTRPASAVADMPAHHVPAANDPSTTPKSPIIPSQSPTEVAKLIHAARTTRDGADEIGAYLVESRRECTLEFLAAIDKVLAADDSLHERVRKSHGVSLPESWNLRVIQDNLGLFSTNVSFISEAINGDEASVTIQEGDHVPLVHAKFLRVDGQWQHEPEAIARGVCPALARVADVIRDVEKSVDEGAPFESLSDAFTFRIMPRIQDVARASEQGQAQ